MSKPSSILLPGADCCLCVLGERSIKKLKPPFRSFHDKILIAKQTLTYSFIIFGIFTSLGHFCGSDLICSKKQAILATNCIIMLLIDSLKLVFTASLVLVPVISERVRLKATFTVQMLSFQ